MRGRRSWVWFILCGILARYMWIYRSQTDDIASTYTPEVDPTLATQLKQAKITKLLESLSSWVTTLPTNERCREMLVFLMTVHDDIDEEHLDTWQHMYDTVYIPSFAENMIELWEEERNELLMTYDSIASSTWDVSIADRYIES